MIRGQKRERRQEVTRETGWDNGERREELYDKRSKDRERRGHERH